MNLLLPLTLVTSLALSVAPLRDYQPRAEIHVAQSAEHVVGEIIFHTDIEFELFRFMTDPCRLITMDSDYGCPPEEQVQALIKNLLFTFDNHYVSEARDCDDLALEFIVKLRRVLREKSDDAPLAAPVGLVGVKLVSDIPEMGYLLKGKVGYHAIVIVRCAGGKWLLVDPGTKKVSEFTGHLYEGAMELRLVIF